jgi:hypothetical protein
MIKATGKIDSSSEEIEKAKEKKQLRPEKDPTNHQMQRKMKKRIGKRVPIDQYRQYTRTSSEQHIPPLNTDPKNIVIIAPCV